MSSVLFFIAAIGAISGAIGVIALRNPFYCVLSLVVHLISLALLFLLLRSEFVAAVQVVVYAGAVMVLYVFVVAYVGVDGESIGERLRGAGAGPSAAGLAHRRRGPRRGSRRRAADRPARDGPVGYRGPRRRLRTRSAGLRHPRLHRQTAPDPLPPGLRDRLLPAADRSRRRSRPGTPARWAGRPRRGPHHTARPAAPARVRAPRPRASGGTANEHRLVPEPSRRSSSHWAHSASSPGATRW